MTFSSLVRRVQWRVHRAHLDALHRAHPLTYLFLEVTRGCDLGCVYCGSSCGPRQAPDELSIDEWKAAVRQVAQDFDPTRITVSVMGGEPLVKPGILELLRELRDLRFPWGIVSNGQRIDPETARGLVDAGMRTITLSLDGPPEINDRLRGAGTSAGVARAVANLREAGYRGSFEIMSTLTAPAIPHLERMRQHVASLGVPRWRLSLVIAIGRAAHRPELLPGPDDVRRVLDYVLEARKDGLRPVPSFCDEGFLGERYEHNVRSYLWNCLAGVCIGSVLANGGVAACPELGEAFVQGNIRTERFKAIWDQRYQVFCDRSWTRKGACSECERYDVCRGGSLHVYPSPDGEPQRCLYQYAALAQPHPPVPLQDGSSGRRPRKRLAPS